MPKNEFLLENLPRGSRLAGLAAVYPQADLGAMEVFSALVGLSSGILSGINAGLAKYGISQARFRLLLHLRRAGDAGAHPAALAESLGVNRATVTGLLDCAERAGLALRRPCSEDRRGVTVTLTPRGRRLIDSVAPERLRKTAALMAGLSAREKAELTRLLDKIGAGLTEFGKI